MPIGCGLGAAPNLPPGGNGVLSSMPQPAGQDDPISQPQYYTGTPSQPIIKDPPDDPFGNAPGGTPPGPYGVVAGLTANNFSNILDCSNVAHSLYEFFNRSRAIVFHMSVEGCSNCMDSARWLAQQFGNASDVVVLELLEAANGQFAAPQNVCQTWSQTIGSSKTIVLRDDGSVARALQVKVYDSLVLDRSLKIAWRGQLVANLGHTEVSNTVAQLR